MSWFTRKRSFTEGEDILAPDFEVEFDNLAEALNGVAQAGEVSASKDTAFNGAVPGEADISGASKALTLERPSLVQVTANFKVSMGVGTVTPGLFKGFLNVDGADQPKSADFGLPVETGGTTEVVSRSFVLALGAGAHTLKLRGICTGNAAATVVAAGTDLTFLVLPNPEP